MKSISTTEFKHTLKDINENTENRRYCIVVGAGASRKSGIPTGGELATKWYNELKQRLKDSDFKKWLKEFKIDEKDLASSYGAIYRRRFQNDKTSGYEFLVNAMKEAKPSFGHFVLAQILSRYTGHCVLTTNFDSLVESSVYQFTNKTPLVCGHESLSGYARPSNTHPLVIKIHRDLLLNPKSDPDEINKLDDGWVQPLNHIFSTHIPIIIGYGGNDGSLMTYFQNMSKPSNFFWCGLSNEKDLPHKIKTLIEKHDGSYVNISGFDELMYQLLEVFAEIGPVEKELTTITNQRVTLATTQLNEIIKASTSRLTTDKSGKKKEKILSALEYYNLCEKEPDLEKRKQIYLEALEKYPSAGWLWWNFTHFMHFKKRDYDGLEKHYETALPLNKEEAGFLGNYANFLKDIRKDYTKAEAYYLKALSLAPDDATNNGNYASFLKNIKKDYTKAEEYYLKALSLAPDHANNNGNYASFLKNIKKDYTKAEEYYLKALSLAPDHANNNGNYANFLTDIKKDYTKAEEYYLKALSLAPDDADFNGNYAQLLFLLGRKKEAIEHLNKAFENNHEQNDLTIELWFYRYAHLPEYLKEAEKKIEELLSQSIRSIGWNFDGNIAQAIKDKHPNPEKLKEFAKRISTE